MEIPAEFFDRSQTGFLTDSLYEKGSLSYGLSLSESCTIVPSIRKYSLP